MAERRSSPQGVSVAAVCAAMERIAPPALAQSWDNVGLLAGDPSSVVQRVLLVRAQLPLRFFWRAVRALL